MPLQKNQLRILEQLDKLILDTIDSFEGSLNSVNGELLEQLLDFSATLKRNSSGSIKASMENLKLIDKFALQVDKLLLSGKYAKSVNQLLESFADSSGLIHQYFAATVVDFKASESLFKTILKANIDTTVESLLGSGISSQVKEPIIKLLKDNVSGNSSIVDLRKSLRIELVDKGKLLKYSKQISSDALHQFKRNYTQSISNDLGLRHYAFLGPKVKDSRTFCASKKGKYFTYEEVIAWIPQNWDGKIPTTNAATIFTYVGGFGCLDYLAPISESQYKEATR